MKPGFYLFFLIISANSVANAGGSSRSTPPPSTVDQRVDLSRYQGRWYEIARLPNRFQDNCFNSTAEYTLRSDGKIVVVNQCQESNGKTKTTTGTARSTNTPQNSKLKVQFFWPFEGDYWILALDEEYKWAIVGGPDYKYLWILSREIPLEARLMQELLNISSKKGYDTSKLIFDPNIKLR
jgi:apolipoprotein D and lipocalin family protein